MLISQHINFSRLNNKQHKAQAARLCLGRHVGSAGLLPNGGERHYAQVNETKEKSIDSAFEKENTEDGSGKGDLSDPDGVLHSGLDGKRRGEGLHAQWAFTRTESITFNRGCLVSEIFEQLCL